MRMYLDIETRCDRDLPNVGSWKYSKSAVGGINCIAVTTANGTHVHDYEDCKNAKTPAMQTLRKVIANPANVLVCHNATFEADCLRNWFDWDIPAKKFRCTQAKAAYYNLPQSLDEASQTLKLERLKDVGKGVAAMKATMKCDERGRHLTPDEAPDTFKDLYDYCANDTVVCKLIDEKLPDIPAAEQAVWEMSFDINRRGVPIDWFLVENARRLVEYFQEQYDAEVSVLTYGELKSTRQTAELGKWLKTQGYPVDSVDVDVIAELLTRPGLPPTVKRILELRQEQAAASVKKFQTIADRLDTSRLRGEFWYYGAHPGRWTSTGAQMQNMVNGFDPMLSDMLSRSQRDFIAAVYDRPLIQLKGAVRASIQAPEDHRFLGVDLAQIEDRCGAWLSGQTDVLDLYRAGRDVYSETATELLGRPVTKANKLERQVGKTVRLSSIFGGGVGALERGAGKFGVDLEMMASLITPLPFEEVESKKNLDWYYEEQQGTLPEHIAFKLDIIKCRWRRANPRTVQYWDELFNAFKAGHGDCGFIKVRSSASGTRVVKLPCGRDLFYREVRNEGGQISYEGRDGADKRRMLIKGKLFENVVQACDSSVARFYMLLAEKVAEIVHHAHDEYLLCVLLEKFEEVEAKINEIHTKCFPVWAPGLPITYETWSGLRYEK